MGPAISLRSHVVLVLARDDAKANRVMCALSYFDLKNDALA
jgi:hypothetical protein